MNGTGTAGSSSQRPPGLSSRAAFGCRVRRADASATGTVHRGAPPDSVAFSGNSLGNVAEVSDLANVSKVSPPRSFICVGGHSADYTARAILEHGEGAIDCVVKGEGEPGIVKLLEAVAGDRNAIAK